MRLSLSSLCLSLVLAGCAGAAPPGDSASGSAAPSQAGLHGPGETALTRNQVVVRDDKSITQDVLKALRGETLLSGLKIDVATDQGAVKLNGVVKTTDERQRAEGLARTIPGVKEIDNQLELEK